MRFFLKIFGCRLNQAEAAIFHAGLAAAGGEPVKSAAGADIIVLHTCCVTQHAANEVLAEIKKVRGIAPNATIAVCGCFVELAEKGVLEAAGADVIVPRKKLETLPERVLAFRGEMPPKISAPGEMPLPVTSRKRALLRVQDGCPFQCAYCIVPTVRGTRSRSRDWDETLCEARRFVEAGFTEIVMTGCNLACYNSAEKRLPELVAALSEILGGNARLRLGSVEPGTCEVEIARLIAERKNICRMLHMPFQSGDDAILERMGRHYKTAEAAEKLALIRELVPEIAIGSDMITGLPGESEESFARTFEWFAAQKFANLHVFPYSPRPGTRAANWKAPEPKVALARAGKMRALAKSMHESFMRSLIGHETEIVVEKKHRDGKVGGWSDNYVRCEFFAPNAALRSRISFVPRQIDDNGFLTD